MAYANEYDQPKYTSRFWYLLPKIAENLGGSYEPAFEGEPRRMWTIITLATGHKLNIKSSYGDTGKLNIYPDWNYINHDGTKKNLAPHNISDINITMQKEPGQIAKEIKTRLLDDFIPAWNEAVRDHLKRNAKMQDLKSQLAALDTIPDLYRTNPSNDTYYHNYTLARTPGYTKLQVRTHDSMSEPLCKLEIDDLTIPEVISIIKIYVLRGE